MTLIDSGAAGARPWHSCLRRKACAPRARSFGRTACYASGDAGEFARVAEIFLKRTFRTTFKTAVL